MPYTLEQEFQQNLIDLLGDVLFLRYLESGRRPHMPYCYTTEVVANCRQRALDYLEQHAAEVYGLGQRLLQL